MKRRTNIWELHKTCPVWKDPTPVRTQVHEYYVLTTCTVKRSGQGHGQRYVDKVNQHIVPHLFKLNMLPVSYCITSLVPNSTIRTPATDMLHNTTNGQAPNNSTLVVQQICHIAIPKPNISTCQDVGMWQIFVRWWWIYCTTSCRTAVSSSVGGVVQHLSSRCPCSGVWHLLFKRTDAKSTTTRSIKCYCYASVRRCLGILLDRRQNMLTEAVTRRRMSDECLLRFHGLVRWRLVQHNMSVAAKIQRLTSPLLHVTQRTNCGRLAEELLSCCY